MLTYEQYIQIRYLRNIEHLSSVQIGKRMAIPERTVRNWWNVPEYPQTAEAPRGKQLDKFKDWITLRLAEEPKLTGTILCRKLRRMGYAGSESTVRRYLTSVRPKPMKSFLPLVFEPGEAMQLDFGYCGQLRDGERDIKLCICAVVLCHSRLLYAEIIPSEKQEHTFACLQNALLYFGGAPRKIIVDNFKGAVLHHGKHGEIRYHPKFLDFAAHFGMAVIACNPLRPNEKGVIERGIAYIKRSFFNGARFTSLDEAKHALRNWLDTVANVRTHGTTRKQPSVCFDLEEKPALLPLNPHLFDCARLETRAADTRCRVSFDGNQYSVPARCAGLRLKLKITSSSVYIYHEDKLVATHLREYGKGRIISDLEHYKIMLTERKTAARQNLKHDFLALGKDAAAMLREIENRMGDASSHMKKIMLMAEIYGKNTVQNALMSAIENQVYGADYVEYLIRLKARPVENRMGLLHVTQGADNLNISLEAPDLDDYNLK